MYLQVQVLHSELQLKSHSALHASHVHASCKISYACGPQRKMVLHMLQNAGLAFARWHARVCSPRMA